MPSLMNPYINFNGNAREAIEFYKSVFGGKLDMNTYEEAHMSQDPVEGKKIMHAMLTAENGMVLMASDAPPGMAGKAESNISISLSGENEVELRGYWDKLVEGGKAIMPIEKAPWGDIFGMLTDKFGVSWMVNISAPQA
jgi:PhnB protein